MKKENCIFIMILLLFAFENVAYSQMYREWVQRFDGTASSFDIVSGILAVPSGGVIVFGSSVGTGTLTDFALLRYDLDGNQIWSASYNGGSNQSDQISSAVLSGNEDVYVTGFVTSGDNNTKFAAGKFLSNGSLSWVRTLEENGYSAGLGQSVIVSSTDRIICAGSLKNSFDEFKITLASYTSSGALTAKRIINSFGNNFAVSLLPAEAGGIYLAYEKPVENSGSDIAVAKFDSSLKLIWERTFSGNAQSSSDRPSDMNLDRSDNILICGSLFNESTSSDYFIAKLNNAGHLIWQYQYNCTYSDIPSSIATDFAGNCYVTGFSRNGTGLGAEDIFTIKISAGGIPEWTSLFNGSANGSDGGNSVAVDTVGNIYVGGYSDMGDVKVTYMILKLNSAGQLKWSDRYSVAVEPEDFIYSTIVDKENNVYVTGISLSESTDYDIATIKYSNIVGINNSSAEMPNSVKLMQNFPNPFNPSTKIIYELKTESYISVIINDITGRQVASLVNSRQSPGNHEVEFAANGLPSGIYFYSLYSNELMICTKAMVLLK